MGLPEELREWFLARQAERVRFFMLESKKFTLLLEQAAEVDSQIDLKPYLIDLGIDEGLLDRVQSQNVPLSALFCSPGLLDSNPSLIRYYRLLAGMTRKAMGRLSLNVDALEDLRATKKRTKATNNKIINVSKLLNEAVASWVETVISKRADLQSVHDVLRSLYGVEIDGRWRDKSGDEAEIDFQEFLIEYFARRGLVSGLKSVGGTPDVNEMLEGIRTGLLARDRTQITKLSLTNGAHIEFRKDPDAAFYSGSSSPNLVLEIKSGTDYQNALNRLGEAEKSFQNLKAQHQEVPTILLVAAVTPLMKARLEAAKSSVDRYFIIKDVYVPGSIQSEVLGAVCNALGIQFHD